MTVPAGLGSAEDFAQMFLRVPEVGTRRLVPMRLHAAQRRLFAAFDEVDPDTGLPRYPELGALWIKKAGKTTTGAALALYDLIANPYEPEAREILIAGADLAQGQDAVFAQIKRFIRHNDWLRRHLKVTATDVIYPEVVTEARSGGRYTVDHRIHVIASRDPKSAHGHGADLLLCDEWWQASLDLAEALAPSPARRAPRLVYLTYAGLKSMQHDGNVCWDLWSRWKAGDPGLFISHIGGVDGWRQIPWITERFVNQEKRRLSHVFSRFKRLWYNEWASGDESGFLADEEREAAIDRTLSEPERGVPGYSYHGGGDAGSTHDLWGFVISHVDPTDAKLVIDVVRLWRGTKAAPVDFQAVEDEIVRLHQRFALKSLTLDAWQTLHLASRLRLRGLPNVRTVGVETSRLDTMATTLKAIFQNRLIRIPPHPGLIEQLESIVGEELKRRDKVRFTTPRGGASFDDAVVAMMLSADQISRSIGSIQMADMRACARGTIDQCYLVGGWHYGNDTVYCAACPGNVSTRAAYQRHLDRGGEAIGLREFAATGIRPSAFISMQKFRSWADLRGL